MTISDLLGFGKVYVSSDLQSALSLGSLNFSSNTHFNLPSKDALVISIPSIDHLNSFRSSSGDLPQHSSY